jgi:hypothetical protein
MSRPFDTVCGRPAILSKLSGQRLCQPPGWRRSQPDEVNEGDEGGDHPGRRPSRAQYRPHACRERSRCSLALGGRASRAAYEWVRYGRARRSTRVPRAARPARRDRPPCASGNHGCDTRVVSRPDHLGRMSRRPASSVVSLRARPPMTESLAGDTTFPLAVGRPSLSTAVCPGRKNRARPCSPRT